MKSCYLIQFAFLFIIGLMTINKISSSKVRVNSSTSEEDWKRLLGEKWNKSARDCSNFVPLEEQKWFSEHPPPNSSSKSIRIPIDYLHSCVRNMSYDSTIPPFEFDLVPLIEYSFGICEIHELSFDGSLTLKGSFYFEWKEQRLRYKREVTFDTNGIWRFPSHIEMPAKELWTPSFRLANCKMSDCIIAPNNYTIARLYHNGEVDLWMHKMLKSSCEMSFEMFPFDIQNCTLFFVLPDLHRGAVYKLVTVDSTHLEYMYDNDEWVLESIKHEPLPSSVYVLEPMSENNTFNGSWTRTKSKKEADIVNFRVNLTLARYPGFYVSNIIIPTLVVTLVDLLTVLVPMEREGKIELSVTILLAFIFLQSLVAAFTPKQENAPLLGMYILFALVLSGINLIVVVVTLAIYNYNDDTIPPLWLRVIGIRIWRWPMVAVRAIVRLISSCLGIRQWSRESPPANETWKVLGSYVEKLASVGFVVLQVYVFYKFLYPLLSLWLMQRKHEAYFKDIRDEFVIVSK